MPDCHGSGATFEASASGTMYQRVRCPGCNRPFDVRRVKTRSGVTLPHPQLRVPRHRAADDRTAIKIVFSPVVDEVAGDGEEFTRHPYPITARASDGAVLNQEFWRGKPAQIVGIASRPEQQEVVRFWAEVVAFGPQTMVGSYLVVADADGTFATQQVAVESIEMLDGVAKEVLAR